MACFHPRYGYRVERGLLKLTPVRSAAWRDLITVSCGQCVGCKAEQKRQWAVRGSHELQMVPDQRASFLTLTYADENLPINGNLERRHWQLFAKKLRAKLGRFRFIMSGEYGDKNNTERCHFHAVIYGHDFLEDRKFFKTNENGNPLFTSSNLDDLWQNGFSTIGNVEFDSIAYVAGYIQKKINGKKATAHYTRINQTTGEIYDQVPEFSLQSRGDNSKDSLTGYGIGHAWIEKYYPEVYPADQVIVNGEKGAPPDYYDRWYAEHFPTEMEEVKRERRIQGKKYIEDNSPERLATRKKCFTSLHAQYAQRKIK